MESRLKSSFKWPCHDQTGEKLWTAQVARPREYPRDGPTAFELWPPELRLMRATGMPPGLATRARRLPSDAGPDSREPAVDLPIPIAPSIVVLAPLPQLPLLVLHPVLSARLLPDIALPLLLGPPARGGCRLARSTAGLRRLTSGGAVCRPGGAIRLVFGRLVGLAATHLRRNEMAAHARRQGCVRRRLRRRRRPPRRRRRHARRPSVEHVVRRRQQGRAAGAWVVVGGGRLHIVHLRITPAAAAAAVVIAAVVNPHRRGPTDGWAGDPPGERLLLLALDPTSVAAEEGESHR
mmetsp:Transcript_38861/g.96350  ORF Transcript_38861/g.96350 Transcript_38861/m.96350 type:complete len:293 (-) Transcript_38861:7-885(-)